MDVSLSNIWRVWGTFRHGKKRTAPLDIFTYNLEENLTSLHYDLISGNYRHGPYRSFSINDTKRRNISVASIRDRIVHRLIYDYLTALYDHEFIYNVWSCRKHKGLLGAIERTQRLLRQYRYGYVWRADITKFFDTIDHRFLKKCLRRKVLHQYALKLIDMVIDSYSISSIGKGMPIGNLTSQIFANIYLGELDRFVMHTVKPLAYLRYGDDFLLVGSNRVFVNAYQVQTISFINQVLNLAINQNNNIVIPVRRGLHFLGCEIYATGRRLRKKIYRRIKEKLNLANSASYRDLILKNCGKKEINWIDWELSEIIDLLYK